MSNEVAAGQGTADLNTEGTETTVYYGNESYNNEAFMSAMSLIDAGHNDGGLGEADFTVFEQAGCRGTPGVTRSSKRQSLLQTFDPLCGSRGTNEVSSGNRVLDQIDEQAEISQSNRKCANEGSNDLSAIVTGDRQSILHMSASRHMKKSFVSDSPSLITMDPDMAQRGDCKKMLVDSNANLIGTPKALLHEIDAPEEAETPELPQAVEEQMEPKDLHTASHHEVSQSQFKAPSDDCIRSSHRPIPRMDAESSMAAYTSVYESPFKLAKDENIALQTPAQMQPRTPTRSVTASAYRDSRGELYPVTVRDAIQFLSPSFADSFHSPSASRLADSIATYRTAAVAGVNDSLLLSEGKKRNLERSTVTRSPLTTVQNEQTPPKGGLDSSRALFRSPVRGRTSTSMYEERLNQSGSSLLNTSLQFSARHLATDIEALLASARAATHSYPDLSSKYVDNPRAAEPEPKFTPTRSGVVANDIGTGGAPVVDNAVNQELLRESAKAQALAELQAKQAEEQRIFEAKRDALLQKRAALENQLAEAKKCNEELSVLARAGDTRVRLASQVKRREEAKCSVTQREVQQLSAAFSEHLKLENASKSAIESFEQFEERARITKTLLDATVKKVADTCERLAKVAKEKAAEASQARTHAQREVESLRGELETKARKLRIDIEANRGTFNAKTKEASELNQIIADLSKMRETL